MIFFEKSVCGVSGLLLLMFYSVAEAVAADTSSSLPGANPWGVRVELGYTHDDNVSRSNESRLTDDILSLNVSKAMVVPLSQHTRVLFSGMIGGDKFRTYTGLGRIFGGVHGDWMYRVSSEFGAPTWAIFGRAVLDQYKSSLRDGSRFSTGVSVRKPLTDRVTLMGALARNVRNSESSVFDTKDTALRMNLDYAVTSRGTLYLSGEHRQGDIVFSMRSDVAGVGVAHQADDVLAGVYFGAPYAGAARTAGGGGAGTGTPYFSYRLSGKTGLVTLGYNFALSSHSSFDLLWRTVRSTPDAQLSYTPPSYTTNQLSLAYLTAF